MPACRHPFDPFLGDVRADDAVFPPGFPLVGGELLQVPAGRPYPAHDPAQPARLCSVNSWLAPAPSSRTITRRRKETGTWASAADSPEMWSDAVLSGSRGALPRPGPLRTVLARFPGTRLKQALKAQAAVAAGGLRGPGSGVSRS